ncbi:carbohydrate ABC transporter permease [Metabacillus halosaccharovorans]|uniref:carbohydrate ABC transporter permease n=1 Tax=Metabacillus halosaccharovorans TaxID=930124 RepID=UPI001C1F65D8|nr:carbohydrate ABC transporter permease [Metabacillus halosaccharovorans]MBU7592406.1 carbohydrate ABC transporter permease [Metabacillus halosaccharovorans]
MKKSTRSVVFHFFTISIGFIMLYPILWTLASSLKPESEVFKNAASLIPNTLELGNYVQGWKGFGGITFGSFFLNSGLVTLLVVIGTLFSSSLVAFGFARLDFKFKRVLFICLLGTIMLPTQVTLIPQYVLFHNLGWVNTYNPLTLPAFFGGSAFFIFLMIQFIKGIPRELDEAAVIDGCSTFGIFYRIILPLMKPTSATVAIFSFYWTWDDFMGPLIYLNDPNLFTVSLGLRLFSDPSSVTEWGPLFAMSIVSLLPVFIIFLFFQKYLVEGISTTGLK